MSDNQERFRLDSNGNFGIGVFTPDRQYRIPNYHIDQDRVTDQGWHYVTIPFGSPAREWLLEQDSNTYSPNGLDNLSWIMCPELTTIMVLKF